MSAGGSLTCAVAAITQPVPPTQAAIEKCELTGCLGVGTRPATTVIGMNTVHVTFTNPMSALDSDGVQTRVYGWCFDSLLCQQGACVVPNSREGMQFSLEPEISSDHDLTLIAGRTTSLTLRRPGPVSPSYLDYGRNWATVKLIDLDPGVTTVVEQDCRRKVSLDSFPSVVGERMRGAGVQLIARRDNFRSHASSIFDTDRSNQKSI